MPLSHDAQQQMVEAAQALGLPDPSTQLERFGQFYDLLQSANQKQNLTTLQSENQVVIKHFIDSLSCALMVALVNQKTLDIGSGAGFPGIPLKLMFGGLSLDLLEAERRKQEFLSLAIQQLGLTNSHALWGRAETLAHRAGYREAYDLVVMRAVSTLSQSAELALGFVRPTGYLVVMKGPGLEDELADGGLAAERLGGVIESIRHLELPNAAGSRFLVLVRKTTPTPVQFPRSAAAISKRPLQVGP